MGEDRKLVERALSGSDADQALVEEVARALGWRTRISSRLGLAGRTPGRKVWVQPDPPWTTHPRLPSLLGPRTKVATINRLRVLLAQPTPEPNHD